MSKNNRKRTYTKEFKASVLKRLEPSTDDTPTILSRELNISRTTIYQWIQKDNENKKNSYDKPTNKWTSEDKFYAVMETATLTETEFAEYCRKNGIYISELKEWRTQCINANKSITEDPKELKEVLKVEKEKNKELEKELRFKEKALAETAALLVLRKKQMRSGGPRERMISDSDCIMAVEMNKHRGRTKPPVKKEPPTHIATAPNQVWTWDITWLNAAIKGEYFKLYLIVDMFSRFIVAYEVWEEEKASYAKYLIRKATLSQETSGMPLVLHSDNGSPMKSATFQATLEKLGIQSSFSRPRVSNDNPYSEVLFKTMKYNLNIHLKALKALVMQENG